MIKGSSEHFGDRIHAALVFPIKVGGIHIRRYDPHAYEDFADASSGATEIRVALDQLAIGVGRDCIGANRGTNDKRAGVRSAAVVAGD